MGTDVTVRVGFDRWLDCAPFTDQNIHEHPIVGVGFEVLFHQLFQVSDTDKEPPGAAQLNAQLRVSYTPEEGFEFHPYLPSITFTINRHYIAVQPHGPGYSETESVSSFVFASIMKTHASRFVAESHLENLTYSVTPSSQFDGWIDGVHQCKDLDCAPCVPIVGDRVVVGEYGPRSSRQFRLVSRDIQSGDCTIVDIATGEQESRDIYELGKMMVDESLLSGVVAGTVRDGG